MWSKRKAIKAAAGAIGSYEGQEQLLRQELAEVEKEKQENLSSLKFSCKGLAKALAGKSLSEDHVQKVADGLKLPSLRDVFDNLESERKRNLDERDELAGDRIIINRLDLIESPTASLTEEYNLAKSVAKKALTEKKELESKEFLWLFENEFHLDNDHSGFKKMWRFVTLKARKENKYSRKVEEQYSKSYKAVVLDYNHLSQVFDEKNEIFNEVEIRYANAVKLINRYDHLSQWEKTYESIALESIAEYLEREITTMSDTDLVRSIPCLLYTSPSPRDKRQSRMPSSA